MVGVVIVTGGQVGHSLLTTTSGIGVVEFFRDKGKGKRVRLDVVIVSGGQVGHGLLTVTPGVGVLRLIRDRGTGKDVRLEAVWPEMNGGDEMF